MKAIQTVLYSFVQHLVHLEIRRSIPEIWRASKGLVRALRHRRRSNGLAVLRDNACTKCPLYDTRWQTCGTPGEVRPALMAGAMGDTYFPPSKIGCWCYLPLANHDPLKDCWARANGLDIGWPDALRPTKEKNL